MVQLSGIVPVPCQYFYFIRVSCALFLPCFDTVGRVAGRASQPVDNLTSAIP